MKRFQAIIDIPVDVYAALSANGYVGEKLAKEFNHI